MIRALMLCLVLAGCAAAPQVIEKLVEVRVPVAVPCKTAEIPEPDWPLAKVPATLSGTARRWPSWRCARATRSG